MMMMVPASVIAAVTAGRVGKLVLGDRFECVGFACHGHSFVVDRDWCSRDATSGAKTMGCSLITEDDSEAA